MEDKKEEDKHIQIEDVEIGDLIGIFLINIWEYLRIIS